MRGMRARSAAGVSTLLALCAFRRAGTSCAGASRGLGPLGVLAPAVLAQCVAWAHGAAPSLRPSKAMAVFLRVPWPQPWWMLRLGIAHAKYYCIEKRDSTFIQGYYDVLLTSMNENAK